MTSETLRDHFAAAALTGLLAQGDDGSFSEESYARAAYRWADAMLRERSRAGQLGSGCTDAAAKCTERDSANHDAALTDAEREAVERGYCSLMGVEDMSAECSRWDAEAADTLRGLLERLG